MKPITQDTKAKTESPLYDPADLVCRYCGAVNEGITASYTENITGCATVSDQDGNLEDYETSDSTGFTIMDYTCCACSNSENQLGGLIFSDEELQELNSRVEKTWRLE